MNYPMERFWPAFVGAITAVIGGLGMLVTAGTMLTWPISGIVGGDHGGNVFADGNGHGAERAIWWLWNHDMFRLIGVEALWPFIGIAASLVVLLGAVVIAFKPSVARGWGFVILIASTVALMVGGVGFISGLVGAIGGICAMFAWRREATLPAEA
jgi:hypothetical protein